MHAMLKKLLESQIPVSKMRLLQLVAFVIIAMIGTTRSYSFLNMETEFVGCEVENPEVYLIYDTKAEDPPAKMSSVDFFAWKFTYMMGQNTVFHEDIRRFMRQDINTGHFLDKIVKLPNKSYTEMSVADKKIFEVVRSVRDFFERHQRKNEDIILVKSCATFCGSENEKFCFAMKRLGAVVPNTR